MISLIPAGTQQWFRNVVGAQRNRFAYCSSLAVYLYKEQQSTFELEKIITHHKETITSLTWSPHNLERIASCSQDKEVIVWNIDNEKIISSITLDEIPVWLEWSPSDPSVIAVGDEKGRALLWDYKAGNKTWIKEIGTQTRIIKWNTNDTNKIATGNEDGSVFIYDTSSKQVKQLKPSEGKGDLVIDLQWDPLSTNYLLVAYKSGVIKLIDTDSLKDVFVYEKQNVPISSVRWIASIPGGFLTTDTKSGLVKIWNVSQNTPKELVKIRKSGVHNLVFMANTERCVCSFRDGSVYDIKRRRWDFLTETGHTETIFDVHFKPSNPDILATASFDTTVKLWNIATMKCIESLPGHESVVYALAWSPINEELIAGTAKGKLFLWDLKLNRVSKVFEHHKEAIYRVAWSSLEPTMIASCSKDTFCLVINPNGDILRSYKHPKAAYGCDWSPTNKDWLVTGCLDGIVRIFSVSSSSKTAAVQFVGHTSRVFNVAFSPLLPNLIVSGSDDKTIRVWDANANQAEPKILKGHNMNVRALLWSTEIPWLVFSGSWDATVRLWDIRTQECIKVVHDHHSDVYGLSCSPLRPFVLASSSRDTTLRVWSLESEPTIARLRLKALWKKGNTWKDLLVDSDALMNSKSKMDGLCGVTSRKLSNKLTAAVTDLERFKLLCDFFLKPEGANDFWDLVKEMNDSNSSTSVIDPKSVQPTRTIMHMNYLISSAESKAKSLESKVGLKGSVGPGMYEKRLREAAVTHLRLGHIKEYCDILVELQEWEKAISIAPSVSMEYWQSLSSKYAVHLATQDSENAEEWLMITNNLPKLLDFYVAHNRFEDGVLVSKVVANGGFDKIAKAMYVNVGEESKTAPSSDSLRHITEMYAETHFMSGRPILAACCHLAVNDVGSAIQKLMRGHEVELACLLVKAVKSYTFDHVYEELAYRCEKDLALEILESLRDPLFKVSMLCVRYSVAHPSDAPAFFDKAGIRSAVALYDDAKNYEASNQTEEAVRCYLLSNDLSKAVDLVVNYIKASVTKGQFDAEKCKELLWMISNGKVDGLEPKKRAEVLSLSAYVGGQLAIPLKYSPLINYLFSLAHKLVTENSVDFPVPTEKLQELAAKKEDVSHRLIVASGSNIPTKREKRLESLISHSLIQGQEFLLEDGVSAITQSEALMWWKVNPFSPLCTGKTFNPL